MQNTKNLILMNYKIKKKKKKSHILNKSHHTFNKRYFVVVLNDGITMKPKLKSKQGMFLLF